MSDIDSRYTIEYVSEKTESKSVSSSTIKKFMMLVLLLGAFGFSIWKGGDYLAQYRQNIPFLSSSSSSSSSPVDTSEIEQTVEDEEPEIEDTLLDQSDEVADLNAEPVTPTPAQQKKSLAKANLQPNVKSISNTNRLDSKTVSHLPIDDKTNDDKTKLLEKKIQELTNQLSSEKKKNDDLIERINKNKELSKNIADIYNDVTEDDVSAEDEGFLKVLEKEFARQNAISDSSKKKPNNHIEMPEKVIASTKAGTSVKNIAIGESTMSQVNKIIFAMGGGINRGVDKKIITRPSQGMQEKRIVNKMIDLQSAVDKLIDPKDLPDTKFAKALEKEAELRKNAVRMIVVKKGETLWGIAKRAYGDGNSYPKILRANPELKRGKIVLLSVGQVLRVPI